MRIIKLTQGKFAIVDNEDYERINKHKWCSIKDGGRWYAMRTVYSPFKKTIRMHRQIMDALDGLEIDHINGNGLDNRRSNLRLCTHAENKRNMGKRSDNTSGFKGVTRDRQSKKWIAQIRMDGKCIKLGRFNSKKSAAHAYDAKARKLFGKFARTNFSAIHNNRSMNFAT